MALKTSQGRLRLLEDHIVVLLMNWLAKDMLCQKKNAISLIHATISSFMRVTISFVTKDSPVSRHRIVLKRRKNQHLQK